jgi:uracil-DNA glycosylase
MTDERHPAEELARLAAGLGAVLDRRRRSGHRHLPRPGASGLELPPAPAGAPPTATHPNPGEAAPPGGETAPAAPRSAPASEISAERGAEERRSASPAASARPAAQRPADPSPPPAAAPIRAESAGPSPTDSDRRAALTKGLSPRAAELFLAKLDQVADAARSARDLGELAEGVAGCTACRLCEGRTQTVFADGAATARVMFIGEGPGAEEDRTGVPFVGAAGQLLTGIIEKGMRLSRENDVYIANVVKCRPPENRDPTPHEKAICSAWLDRQIELVDPELIIPLGGHAAKQVLGQDLSIGKLRNRVHEVGGRKCVPTYHPAWVLHQGESAQPAAKQKIWADIQLAMAQLGI